MKSLALLIYFFFADANECPTSSGSLLQRSMLASGSGKLQTLAERSSDKVSRISAGNLKAKAKARSRKQLFEGCKASSKPKGSATFVGLRKQTSSGTCSGTEILVQHEQLSGVSTSCCGFKDLSCAGCAEIGNGQCSKCAGGYTLENGQCTICADTAHWVTDDGSSCHSATCSDTKHSGLSSNDACCKCGGGVRAATPFTYKSSNLELGGSLATIFPVPRTATKYSVDANCEFMLHGLSIDGATGQLILAAGCSEVGCGSPKSFSTSCTITAHQTAELNATAVLKVTASSFSYASNPLVARAGQTSFSPQPSVTGASMACVPDSVSTWLSISENGELSASVNNISVAGLTGMSQLGVVGGRCLVSATGPSGPVNSTVTILAPQPWQSFSYDHNTVFSAIGQTAPPMKVTGSKELLAPSRFSAACDSQTPGTDFAFDTITGMATVSGHLAFTLDPASGTLHLTPTQALENILDGLDQGSRRKISLKCKVYGHYMEQQPNLQPLLAESQELMLELRDDICWVNRTANFAGIHSSTDSTSLKSCLQACRDTPDCTDIYYDGSKCHVMKGLCLNSKCPMMQQQVQMKVPNCGERTTCIDIKDYEHGWMSGEYCPMGESTDGPVFLKQGETTPDTLYLAKFDSTRDGPSTGCLEGDYVLKQAMPGVDFEDPESSYIELKGEVVKCVGGLSGGRDLIDAVFSDGKHSSATIFGTVTTMNRRRTSITSFQNCQGNCSSDSECEGTSVCGINLHKKGGVPGCEGQAEKGINYCYQPEQYEASVTGLACGAPNTTMDTNDEEGSEELSVSMLVFDDPATDDIEADHWLHPCDCFPESWGPAKPVSQESYTAVPAGSNNMFVPGKVEIVTGSFTCESKFLIDSKVHFEGIDSGSEEGCSALCAANECAFFWEGQVADSKQCRLFNDCTTLVREAGTEGTLFAKSQPGVSYCRIADPATCWKVRGRRDFLGAAMPGSGELDCAYGDLLQQCDHKLLLGGFGVEKCGVCTYSEIADTQFLKKRPLPTAFDHGQKLGVGCWEERFRASAVSSAGAVKTQETLTCVSGTWLDSSGEPGLSNFACAACLQVVSPPYSQLDGRSRQELYFSSRMELTVRALLKTEKTLMRSASLNGHTESVTQNPSSPLLECQGNCDSDDDCAGGLMCYKQGTTEIPGCKGDGKSTWGYCIAGQHFKVDINTVGNWKYPLEECEGECSSDATCKSGLKCWTSGGLVPGCSGDSNGVKYCYDPSRMGTIDGSPGGDGKGKLFECQGDCDSDDECYGDLKCFQSDTAQPYVPNCGGTAVSGWDYCYDPNFPGLQHYNEKGNPISNGGVCEGDCDSDSECADGFKCFQRDSGSAPGCVDVPKSGWDTCFDPNAPTSNTYQSLASNLPARKLVHCEGDCDSDSDCEGDLVCGQRDSGDEVHGCTGSASGGTDYCIEPTSSLNALDLMGSPWPSILGECEGDCDSDNHCDVGLECFQRSGSEAIPGCEGSAKNTWDYCYDPRKADENAGTVLDLDLIGFVAKTLASMPEELKLFQSTGDSSMCLSTDPQGGVASMTCSESPKEEEMLTVAMLPSLLKEEFLKPGVIPDGVVDSPGVKLAEASLDDFTMHADCGEFAVSGFGFVEKPTSKLSMFATCGLAADIGEPTEHYAELGGEVDLEFSTCTAEHSDTGANIIYSLNGGDSTQLGSSGRAKGDKDKDTISYTGAFKTLRIKTTDSDGWQICKFKFGGEDMPTASLTFNFPELPCFVDDNNNQAMNTASPAMNGGSTCSSAVLEVTGNRALFELANARMECPEGQVITGISKEPDRFVYNCSAVASLGSCSFGQSPQVDMSSGVLDGLRNLQVACPEGEILSALVGEESSGGKWLRYRYSCCATSGVPLAVEPSGRFVNDNVQLFEGIYCPVARDVSGRVSFERVKSFATNTAGMKLLYDRDNVKWCVEEEEGGETHCQNSDAAHPLEAGFEGTSWEAVALSDFDGVFEAKGSSKPAAAAKMVRKKPTLIKFGAARPEYKEECKDEVTPGESDFDLEKMNEVGMGLEDGNPCKLIAGKMVEEVKETEMGPLVSYEPEGSSTWWTHGYDDTDSVSGAGTTYDSTRSCADREISRDLKASEWSYTHDTIENVMDLTEGMMQMPCALIPAVAAAAMGFGPSWDSAEVCESVMDMVESGLAFGNNQILIENEQGMAIDDNADCNSLQHFISRTFCDLHCLRDSVRAGDEAILKALEDAVAVIGENTDLLMEHYAGTLQDSIDILLDHADDKSLMQETAKMKKGLQGMFLEMRHVVKAGLGGHSTVMRAMTGFKSRMKTAGGSNVSAYLQKAAGEAQTMHATLRASAKGKLDTSATVASQSAQEAAKMQQSLQVRTHMLGVYHSSAKKAKERQVLLRKSPLLKEDILDEIRTASARTMLLDVDRSWWAMRDELDKWFDTATSQAESYGKAFAQMDEYTSCKADYSELHSVYKHAMKAERLAQEQLRKTWESVVQELGLLAAKIQDGEAFLQFGRLDVSGLSMEAIPGLNHTSLCEKDLEASSRKVLAELRAPRSFVQQTWVQVQHIFKEMSMLRGRFSTSGLTEPSEKPVLGAWWRLATAYQTALAQQEQLAGEAVERLRREECPILNWLR